MLKAIHAALGVSGYVLAAVILIVGLFYAEDFERQVAMLMLAPIVAVASLLIEKKSPNSWR